MSPSFDFEALYRHRFKGVDNDSKFAVWSVIAKDIARRTGNPERVLDPACGAGEFISTVPAAIRWCSDVVPPALSDGSVTVKKGLYEELELPLHYFDLIFFSNVLEHLASPNHVQDFLQRAKLQLRPGGRVAIMGPNFRYCAKEYFDCADHSLILTHTSVEEHLVSAGYRVESVIGRYLPFSFRSRLPASPTLTSLYLRSRAAQSLLGKQFLLVASPVE